MCAQTVSRIFRPVGEGSRQPRASIGPEAERRCPRHAEGLAGFLDREPAEDVKLSQLGRRSVDFLESRQYFVEVDPRISVNRGRRHSVWIERENSGNGP